ncbi:hypothetical protein EAL2_c07630 [Peptoclostridium acidaminophilum DSM 3953]|uniref:Uncharacterized protein n=1 Tax=Peptoclostridium acidaminophilum DSM 3953 TaxID=1286171 RepID=W8T2U3_PEPAC|nr:hypothetical protein [Peptoclostridium acidaminophilum]AHM56064.1 hypothetical protein EAL2_c07630 [Peptoclostridium acidaminophilum DSM 3953]
MKKLVLFMLLGILAVPSSSLVIDVTSAGLVIDVTSAGLVR